MNILKITTALAFALPLFACAADPIPAARISAPVVMPASADLTSSIRGTRVKGLFGSEGCFVAGIDGKIIPQAPRVYETPIPIAAGVHSLLIGGSTSRYSTMAARLEAKPGTNYVIHCGRETNIPLYPNRIWVWVENDATKETVVPNRQLDGEAFKLEHYFEPQAPANTLATIRSKNEETETTVDFAYLVAVDGLYVTNSEKNPARSFKVNAGIRAIVLGAYTGRAFTEYPVLLDAEAGHTYVIKYVLDSGVVPGITNERFTVWVDDKTTGVRVVPAQRVKLKKVPGFTSPVPLVIPTVK